MSENQWGQTRLILTSTKTSVSEQLFLILELIAL